MRLADTAYDNSKTGCCAELDTSAWDRTEIVWEDKPFLKDKVRAFMHVPLNYGAVMSRDHKVLDDAAAWPEQPLVITDEVSPWRSEVYFAIEGEIPNAETTTLSGRFLSRVFEGRYRDAPAWVREMKAWARERGQTTDKMLFYYATCPKCAKRLGKNQVVLLARIAESVDVQVTPTVRTKPQAVASPF